MKIKRILSLLRSKETRGSLKAADARVRGHRPTKLERSLSDEAQASAQIAYDLAVIGRDICGKAVEPEKIAAAAMFHDVWGGETPRYSAVLSFETDGPEYAQYLRAADLIAAYLHCRARAAEGDGQYEEAEHQLLEGILELELPEAETYMARLDTKKEIEEK